MTDLATLGIAVESKEAASAASDLDKLTASAAKAEQATKSLEQSTTKTGTATAQMGKQVSVALKEYDKLSEVEKGLASQANTLGRVATATGHMSSASKLGATQLMALSHSARSAAESLILGASPMQVLTQQANHLSYALTGPQGLIAASAGVRAAFGTWLTTLPGLLTTAGVAAAAAVGAYLLATREDIKSADEILEGHKNLIDEITNAYPQATAALKKYEEQAGRMPKSVIAADTRDQVEEAQKTLSKLMNDARRQMELLSQSSSGDGDFARVGKAGQAAFAELADELKSGTMDAEGLQNALGKLRLDPALNKNARDIAKGLQETAAQAAKVAASIPADLTAKGIAVDGQKAVKTLADLSDGFKDVGSRAGSADSVIGKLFGTLNSGGSDRFGVSKMGGAFQGLVGQFEQVDTAIQNARRDQLQGMLDLEGQLRKTTEQTQAWKDAISSAAGKDNIADFFGDVSNIANANSELQNSVDTVNKLFDALNTGNTSAASVASGLDMVRQTLIRDGFGVDQVNKFIDSLIRARMQMDAGVNDAKQLNSAIQAIKNRTVTITVVTRKVGSGTQSIYDVPNGSGGTSTVGVTRYGGDGETSGPSITSNSVPRTSGYGSMGGSGDLGSTNVNVTRFATGGIIHPGDTQRVSFFKSPEETVGIFTPNQMSALANPQSGFTGRQATEDQDRITTVLMNIEAKTSKTFNALDDMKASSSYGGSSSYSSSSSSVDTSQRDEQSALYSKILASVKANFQAAGIVGRGIIGYGLDGLAATPEQIARNILNGQGGGSLGNGGTTSYERDMAQDYSNTIRSVFRGVNNLVDANGVPVQTYAGFATGGMIGGGPGDTQKVEFFKNPDEKVIIARPDQFEDRRTEAKSDNSQRPISISMPIYVQAGAQVTKDSAAEIRRQVAVAFRDAQRSVNGR